VPAFRGELRKAVADGGFVGTGQAGRCNH
jgi:hypothetical protein